MKIFICLVVPFVPGSVGLLMKETGAVGCTQTISLRGASMLRYAMASFKVHTFTPERARNRSSAGSLFNVAISPRQRLQLFFRLNTCTACSLYLYSFSLQLIDLTFILALHVQPTLLC